MKLFCTDEGIRISNNYLILRNAKSKKKHNCQIKMKPTNVLCGRADREPSAIKQKINSSNYTQHIIISRPDSKPTDHVLTGLTPKKTIIFEK